MYNAGGERTSKYSKNDIENLYVDKLYQVQVGVYKDCITMHIFAGDTRIVSKVTYEDLVNNAETEQKYTFYYHGDHLGSSNFITDKDGEVFEHMEYMPYGETWIEEGNDNQKFLNYLFTSKEFDSETGLYYFGARYLDPVTSRWMSCDPIYDGVKDGLGLYTYCRNNPIIFHDPTGLEPDDKGKTSGGKASTADSSINEVDTLILDIDYPEQSSYKSKFESMTYVKGIEDELDKEIDLYRDKRIRSFKNIAICQISDYNNHLNFKNSGQLISLLQVYKNVKNIIITGAHGIPPDSKRAKQFIRICYRLIPKDLNLNLDKDINLYILTCYQGLYLSEWQEGTGLPLENIHTVKGNMSYDDALTFYKYITKDKMDPKKAWDMIFNKNNLNTEGKNEK